MEKAGHIQTPYSALNYKFNIFTIGVYGLRHRQTRAAKCLAVSPNLK